MNKKALIQKFLNNEADSSEAAQALQYLNESPELLDELLPESEWEAVEEQPLPLEAEASIREELLRSTIPVRIPAYVKAWAVAASVIFVIASLFVWNDKKPEQSAYVATTLSITDQEPAYDTLINTGNGQRTILLEDGSKVQLFGHSSLIVPVSMKDSRAMHLYGKAIFHVTKNPNLPFTVNSGSISTTALGTVFLVDATPNQATIQVALYEGKVVVKPIDYTLRFEATYLNPGQQLKLNLKAGSIDVSSILQMAVHAKPVVPEVQTAMETDPLSLNFLKIPLSIVFENLERRFGKSIRLDTTLVQSNLFTGSFNEEDSLHQILQVIGTMNGLQVLQEPTGFALLKKQAVQHLPAQPEAALIAELLPSGEATEWELKPVRTAPLAETAKVVTGVITKTSEGENFRQTTLAALFDHLQQKHKIRIIYNKEKMQELFISGRIPDDQSYINMLQVICRMNELKLQKMKRGVYSVEPGK